MWSWNPTPFGKRGKTLWRYMLVIAMWTTWEEHNCKKKKNQDKTWDVHHVIEMI